MHELSILILEGNPDYLLALMQALLNQKITVKLTTAASLEDGSAHLTHGEYDVILIDLYLPDSQGIDTFLHIQKKAGASPIVIVGEVPIENAIREAIRLGAQDYLPRSEINSSFLIDRLYNAIERHHLHESLKALSFTDELTGVYNRRGFMTLLQQQILLAQRMKKGFYLFLIDLDYLKQINDTYGHLVGDQALIDTAQCLRVSFRHYDIIGRIGGDEFAVIAINTPFHSGDHFKYHMHKQLKEYNRTLQAPYTLSFSIGTTYYNGTDPLTLDTLLQLADKDLYQEKRLSHH